MGTVTLGGRTFEVRPLTVGDGLDAYDQVSPSEVGAFLLTRALVSDPPVTMAWLRSLPLSEMGKVLSAINQARNEAGMTATAAPGEASGPATT